MDVAHIGVLALALALLLCNWWIGEQETKTKVIVTGVYLLTWALVFVGFWAVTGAQAILAIVLGMMTFGIDWMMRQ